MNHLLIILLIGKRLEGYLINKIIKGPHLSLPLPQILCLPACLAQSLAAPLLGGRLAGKLGKVVRGVRIGREGESVCAREN